MFSPMLVNGNGEVGIEDETVTRWCLHYMTCPACKKALLNLSKRGADDAVELWTVYPRHSSRPPAPKEVPAEIAEDFNEAALVLTMSPKASAALSRRCLQATLRENGYTQNDLAPAIKAALESNTLPAALAENLDAVRNIGNFAAHPMKDKQTNAVLPVDPHEAEWNLEVLEGLFDHYYVQPAKAAARRDALNKKLEAAGKPPLKTGTGA
ncbi:DUF4145 domain-containing protein [Delftia sp. DLF01]|uniref:DUF4145 domain-containing protein n=1 Tax=Delftia sp. DLF01 TaxID=2769279 RepID=UPI001CE18044|nr:DUF4145 domain-containing protein [Delftia sp. DLF01]